MLSKKQLEIINSEEQNIVVLAAAASGKTEVLTKRVEYILNKPNVKPEDVVVITFTNAAAEEMRERLNNPLGLFIGTIHSYANYLLLANGIQTSKYLESDRFDELFEILEMNPSYMKKVKYLFLDEAQDSNELQFNFIFNLVEPESFFMVADFKQCIYEWNGSRPDILNSIIQREDVYVYNLNENYRNGSNILNYAKTTLINVKPKNKWMFDDSIPMYPAAGRVIEMENNLTKISNFIEENGKYGDWFVLTRTNAQLDKVCDYLKRQNIPCDTFRRSELDNKELNKRMKENTVKVLTIHTSKGLENKNVVVIGSNFRTSEECRISYVAATRAKEILIWTTTKKKKKPIYYNWE